MHDGVIANEHVLGVHINIEGVKLHADAFRRCGAQIIPYTRRILLPCIVTDAPTLLEPVHVSEIQCPETAIGGTTESSTAAAGGSLRSSAGNPAVHR